MAFKEAYCFLNVEFGQVTKLWEFCIFFSFKSAVIIGHLLWFLSSLDSFIPFAVFFMVFGKKKGWWKGTICAWVLAGWHWFYGRSHWDVPELPASCSAWLVWVCVQGDGLGAFSLTHSMLLPGHCSDLVPGGTPPVPVTESAELAQTSTTHFLSASRSMKPYNLLVLWKG